MTKIKNWKGKIAEEKLFLASQWQLILRRFLRHRLAVVSVVILAVLYFSAIFAEFISPMITLTLAIFVHRRAEYCLLIRVEHFTFVLLYIELNQS